VLDLDGQASSLELTLATSVIAGARFGGHGETPPLRMTFAPVDRIRVETSLADLANGPRTVPLGVLERKVIIGLAPHARHADVAFTLRDASAAPGINAYWVRVVQTDMEMAWTSPVFVDFAPDPRRA
jgi:hypothetical protein